MTKGCQAANFQRVEGTVASHQKDNQSVERFKDKALNIDVGGGGST